MILGPNCNEKGPVGVIGGLYITIVLRTPAYVEEEEAERRWRYEEEAALFAMDEEEDRTAREEVSTTGAGILAIVEAATASRSNNKVDERSVEVEVLFVTLADRNAVLVSSVSSASSRAKSVACNNARRCVSLRVVEGCTSFVVSVIITTDRTAVAFQKPTTTQSLSQLPCYTVISTCVTSRSTNFSAPQQKTR